MTPFLASQILAGLTLITGMTAFQMRRRVHMLRVWSLAAAFAAVHFYLLGSPAAALVVGVTALRFLVSSFTTNKRMMWLFLLLAVTGFALVYKTPISLLGLLATIIGTIGSFHGTEKAVHYAAMAAEILWVVHNIVVWSPVGIVMEVCFFASNLIGLLRHQRATESAL